MCVDSIFIDFIKALFNLCMALMLKVKADLTPRSINLEHISTSLDYKGNKDHLKFLY